ncbi:hypothetical protein [Roseomonas harenae]|jgi:hypothetical protein|uniref:hypothetical protein n=1 Tax=Muricoccus harenae TaxID=2692566 RepID=UPI0013317D04|nr:hypothetical protein [Roseomonas harenae]
MATARPPKGYARLLLVEGMADPQSDHWARVLVEYETAHGIKSTVLSPERAKELGLFDAHWRKQLVPIPTP